MNYRMLLAVIVLLNSKLDACANFNVNDKGILTKIIETEDKNKALIYAVKNHKTADVQILLEDKKANANSVDEFGNSALLLAFEGKGNASIVELLLANGAKPEFSGVGDAKAMAPLVFATIWQHKEIVKLLLDYGANVNRQDLHGNTVLMRAVHYYDQGVFELLLNPKADVNLQNSSGETVLMIASKYNNIEPVELLLDRKDININLQNKKEDTALSIARKKYEIFPHYDCSKIMELLKAKQNSLNY